MRDLCVHALLRRPERRAGRQSRRHRTLARRRWRKRCDGRFGDHPVWPAFHHTVRRFGIPHQYFRDMIDGVASDLEPRRIETFDELYRYCYQVASVVGLTIIHIFGFDTRSALPLAEKCGVAFQLTNILRDIREDAGRGRVYLPAEDLRRFGVTEEDLRSGNRSDGVAAADAIRSRPRARLLRRVAPAAGSDSSAQPVVAVGADRDLLAPARAHRSAATTMCSRAACGCRPSKSRGSWCGRWSAGQPNSGPAIAKTRSGRPGNELLPRYMRMNGRSATKPADSSHCTQSAL